MFIKEILENISEVPIDKKDLSAVAIRYVYFANLLTASICQNSNGIIKDVFACKSVIDIEESFNRMFKVLDIVQFHHFIKSNKRRYYYQISKISSKIAAYSIPNDIDRYKLTDESDFVGSFRTAFSILSYLYKRYVDENIVAYQYMASFYFDLYNRIVDLLEDFEVNCDSKYIIRKSGAYYCIVSSIDNVYIDCNCCKFTYKSGNMTKVEEILTSYKMPPEELRKITNDFFYSGDNKPFFLGGIEFIPFNGGKISYIKGGGKTVVNDFVESFAISKYPVNYEQFYQFLNARPEYTTERFKDKTFLKDYRNLSEDVKKLVQDCAVYYVGWKDAVEFCNYLGDMCGLTVAYDNDYNMTQIRGVRLPTEAEWVYAASDGLGMNYKIDKSKLVCRENREGVMGQTAHNTELYVNKSGVCGMLGNINEWTDTKASIVKMKKFETSINDKTPRKIIKGGSFASSRNIISQNYATDVSIDNLHYIGFRLAIKL